MVLQDVHYVRAQERTSLIYLWNATMQKMLGSVKRIHGRHIE